MPFVSKAQTRWGHSPSGLKALGGAAKVAEWQAETPKGLPEKKKGSLSETARKRGAQK